MSDIQAIYMDRRGAGVCKSVSTEAEALAVLRGVGGIRGARIESNGEVIGERFRSDASDDRRVRWQWWLDADSFKTSGSAIK